MSTFLVTGAAGFVGSAISKALVHQGHTVRGLDDLSTGSLENLRPIAHSVDLVEGDIRDLATVRKVCAGVDYVFHQAAIASVQRSVEEPQVSHEVNVTGTLHVLIAAHERGVKRVVYAASSSAYGNSLVAAKQESLAPAPESPYAAQKLASEHYVQSFARSYGLEGVCLRYFNIFGPHQAANSPYSGVIALFISQMLEGRTPTINGDGSASRDFIFVEDVVRANLLACAAPAEKVSGNVYNIGTGQAKDLNELFTALARVTGFNRSPKYGPSRVGDVAHSLADVGRAAEDLRFTASTGFATGLEKTVNWYRSVLVSA